MSNRDRVEETLYKRIVYGNIARKLPEKLANGHTHRWTVYIKPYCEEKISNYVRKVQFKLHSDYENAVRVVEKEPFEVTETGWGEFPVQIKIYFIDSNERPAICSHYLGLHQPEVIEKNGQIAVVKEVVDEIVFVQPSNMLHEILTDKSLVKPHDTSKWFFNYPDMFKRHEELINELANQSEREVEELQTAIREIAKKCEEYTEKLLEYGDIEEPVDDEA